MKLFTILALILLVVPGCTYNSEPEGQVLKYLTVYNQANKPIDITIVIDGQATHSQRLLSYGSTVCIPDEEVGCLDGAGYIMHLDPNLRSTARFITLSMTEVNSGINKTVAIDTRFMHEITVYFTGDRFVYETSEQDGLWYYSCNDWCVVTPSDKPQRLYWFRSKDSAVNQTVTRCMDPDTNKSITLYTLCDEENCWYSIYDCWNDLIEQSYDIQTKIDCDIKGKKIIQCGYCGMDDDI